MVSMIRIDYSTTRYFPTDDGDREVIAVDHDSEVFDDTDEAVRWLERNGVSFAAWSDPPQLYNDGWRARAVTVDVYVHPGEGWHEETCADVYADDQKLRAIIGAVG